MTDPAAVLRALGTATVYEASGGRARWLRGVAPLFDGAVLAGPARTAWTPPGHNLALHRAIERAAPGDVVVLAAGTVEVAVLGEILASYAHARGVAGIATDGAARDRDRVRELGLPVFAAGLSPAGPGKASPGELDRTVRLGGADVAPGDWLVGDADGLIALPPAALDDTLRAGLERQAREEAVLAGVRQGRSTAELLGLPGLDSEAR